jgi:lysine 2,3-aminomutase
MSDIPKHVPTQKEQAFLDTVVDTKYDRQIINGLAPFLNERVPDGVEALYTKDELEKLAALKGTERDVEDRMPVKTTRHYFDLGTRSTPIRNLVKASPEETENLEGSPDPGNQMDYSPVEGLLHKYEMGLMYVISTCSAHCRFCYREELISRKEIERIDGTVAKKGMAQVNEIVNYIHTHNAAVEEGGGTHPRTGREKLREILLSGGDPMVLSNSKIAGWLGALAEAGIENVRIGTKELAFYPKRFDETFLAMLDAWHAAYPDVGLRMMIHFNHPDEFLNKDEDGNYIEEASGILQWHPDTKKAVQGLTERGWISLENQSPIIKGVNDDPDALRIMQRALKRMGVNNHYFFCGRDIIAHKAFNVPIEEAWHILNESQKGLSGVECHARLSITHYKGKTEVCSVTSEPIPGVPGTENGAVIFKILRSAASAPERGRIAIVGRNPEAVWFDGYKDRVIYDEAGLFDYTRTSMAKEAAEAAEAAAK